jgi:lipid-A-disaccharide synthase-like uncharacterized protein
MKTAIFFSLCTLGGFALLVLTAVTTDNINVLPLVFFVVAYVFAVYRWIDISHNKRAIKS